MSSILGISAFYHDSAACILINGKIIAAAQEERFTRIKHDSNYPSNAVEFVLNFAKLKLSEVDQIIFFEKPFLKFERLLETYVAFAPKGFLSFTKLIPTFALAVFYLTAFYLLTFVVNKLPIAIVYATWSGLGIFTIAILGYIFFKQTLAWQAIAGLFLIVIGVILVNSFVGKIN